ncbi:hypothetical protein [Histidinibacterium aquaticum]|uniref:Glycosyltransferase family 1 protein n=1 Tax=Histidinibacterium aquaticum TaxID=2613962 RepID=A0A5J5GAB4_9RHOB|nr:hypothetical protein [Histidinibacterium aquaticum]KAA9005045.1 hypothetical protein F3S47_18625 [Histidinibacterium aquaticum]
MGLNTLKQSLRKYTSIKTVTPSEMESHWSDQYDLALLHNTIDVPNHILSNSIVYALQSVVNQLIRSPASQERLRTNKPLEIWCNTRSAENDLRRAGIESVTMYRPAPRFTLPTSYIPLPQKRRILWYYDSNHKFMISRLDDIKRTIRNIRDAEILTFPDVNPPVVQDNVSAIGRVQLQHWVPRVHGMVRISDRLDFGRSSFDVYSHGRWLLYHDMEEDFSFTRKYVAEMPSAVDELLATQTNSEAQSRFEDARKFDLETLAEVWESRVRWLIANRNC